MQRSELRYLLVQAALVAAPASVSGAGFPIAVSPQKEESVGAAFDGTNYLVGIQVRDSAPPPNDFTRPGAQLVSPSGTLIGSPLSVVGRVGDAPHVAFDGTNYLLVWGDFTASPAGIVTVYAQRVSPQGSLLGSPFLVSQSTKVKGVDGVAFDGTNYLVIWTDGRRVSTPPTPPQPGDKDIYGRFVSPSGAPVGNEFKISQGAGKEAAVAFAAPNYLVVWNEDFADTEVRGRFITPAGALMGEFSVNASAAPSDNPTRIGFDGTNFLVLWSDEVGGQTSGEWDLFAQRVTPSGALAGGPITISAAPRAQLLPFVAFDGVNYLVIWTDTRNDTNKDFVCDAGEGTCMDVYGQLVSPAGALVGAESPVTTDAGNQGLSPLVYGGGKFLAVWTHGVFQGTSNQDVFGAFIPTMGSPTLSIDDRSVSEEAAVNAAFRVLLSSPTQQTVTVEYATANGSAVSASDYTATSGTLTLTPGRTTHAVFVPILADAGAEGTETFEVRLTNASGAVISDPTAIGTILDPPAAADIPMYRAYNPNAFYHFFTTSLAEFNNAVAAGYRDESNPPCCSIPFKVPNLQGTGKAAIFRMYNPNNGRHYYTASGGERDVLMGLGWVYEKDEGFVYPASGTPGTVEVFKLYNNISGVHLYTVRPEEKDAILAQFPGIWFQHTSLGFAVP